MAKYFGQCFTIQIRFDITKENQQTRVNGVCANKLK